MQRYAIYTDHKAWYFAISPCIDFDRFPTSFFARSNGLWRNLLVAKNAFQVFFEHSYSFAQPKPYIRNYSRDESYNPVSFGF